MVEFLNNSNTRKALKLSSVVILAGTLSACNLWNRNPEPKVSETKVPAAEPTPPFKQPGEQNQQGTPVQPQEQGQPQSPIVIPTAQVLMTPENCRQVTSVVTGLAYNSVGSDGAIKQEGELKPGDRVIMVGTATPDQDAALDAQPNMHAKWIIVVIQGVPGEYAVAEYGEDTGRQFLENCNP